MYCVFAVDELLFSLAGPRAKFIGYLFKFFFINCLIISSVVRNIDVSLDPGMNFGDLMHYVFEDFFLLCWNITFLGREILFWGFFGSLSIFHCLFGFNLMLIWYF